MNRADFKRLANLRIREAKVLLDKRLYAGAYYLAGYAIECALKACIAKRTRRHEFPPSPEVAREIYVHDLSKLLKHAGLPSIPVHSLLEVNWNEVRGKDRWSEQKRYDTRISNIDAQNLYDAIVDPTDGVLTWIKKYW
jgi:HEPN domain-containing protein